MERDRDEILDESKEAESVPVIRTTVGKNTYLVGIHFNEDSTETMTDKIERMIRRDIKNGSRG